MNETEMAMNRTALTIIAVLTIGISVSAPVARAQGGPSMVPRSYGYSPSSPTLSPYLDYFRAPLGPLDSYHEYVRPRIAMENTIAQQERQLRVQAQGLRALNSQWNRAQQTGTLAPTGIGAGFFNYSHFYPGMR